MPDAPPSVTSPSNAPLSFEAGLEQLETIVKEMESGELPLERALEPAETAKLMLYAAEQIKRHEGNGSGHYGNRPKRKRKVQVRILQGLPGIGPDRAAQLLASLGSVEAVMTASQERLEQVEGVGAKTAAGIRQVLQ